MQQPDGLLAAALDYARRSWPVLPLVPGNKRPLTKRGHLDASTDADRIRAWWTRHPEASVGIVIGTRSGILVLDVDERRGVGWVTVASIERLPGAPLHLANNPGEIKAAP